MDIIIDESSKTGYVIYRDDEYEYHLGKFEFIANLFNHNYGKAFLLFTIM